jgi:hypothetical protein
MEQFDPEIQRTFNHAPKIDPFGDPQAEYEHAQRDSSFSDLVPNDKQKPAAGAPFRRSIPYFCISGLQQAGEKFPATTKKLAGTLGLNAAEVK